MHHILHTAWHILLFWSLLCWLVGLVPGFIIGRISKRRSE